MLALRFDGASAMCADGRQHGEAIVAERKDEQRHDAKVKKLKKAYKPASGGVLNPAKRIKVQKLAKKATISSAQHEFSSSDF